MKKNYNFVDDEIDLYEYIQIVIKYKKIIFLTALSFLTIAITLKIFVPKPYLASSAIRLGTFSDSVLPREDVLWLPRSARYLSGVIEKLKLGSSISELRINIEIEEREPGYIRIHVKNKNKELAVKICAYLTETFVQEGNALYEEKFKFFKEQIAALGPVRYVDKNAEQFRSLKKNLIAAKKFEIFEPAEFDRHLDPFINQPFLGAFVLSGLMLGLFMAFFQEFIKKRNQNK